MASPPQIPSQLAADTSPKITPDTSPYPSPKRVLRQMWQPRLLLKGIYPLILLGTIAAHGLLLFVPIPAPTEAEPEAEELVDAPVDLLGLTELPPPPPEPEPIPTPAAPPPPPTAPPPAAPPPPEPQLQITEPAPAAPEPVEPESMPETVPTTEPVPSPPPAPAEPEPPAYDPAAARGQIAGNLGSLGGYDQNLADRLILSQFGRGTEAYEPLRGTVFADAALAQGILQPMPGVERYGLFDKGIEEFIAAMRTTYPSITFEEAGTHLDSPTYAMQDPDGNIVFYLSAYDVRGSVVFVMWSINPLGGA